jgi:hypothetical protein
MMCTRKQASAIKPTKAPYSKVTMEVHLSHNFPATKLEGKVISPVSVANVPRDVALKEGAEISEMYAFCEPSITPPYTPSKPKRVIMFNKENEIENAKPKVVSTKTP